jgi:hypothetical protein
MTKFFIEAIRCLPEHLISDETDFLEGLMNDVNTVFAANPNYQPHEYTETEKVWKTVNLSPKGGN